MTLKKIAELTGTSPSTVSRVLNGKAGSFASAAVRQRILETAAEQHYVPNAAARMLQRSAAAMPAAADAENRRIAIVFARSDEMADDPFFSELYHCIERELPAAGLSMGARIRASHGLPESETQQDGYLIVGRCTHELLGQLQARSENLVGIWRNPMDFDIDEVICDGKKAAALATEYLISHGHKKIAYIGDCSFESRYIGYSETLIRHHLPIDYPLILPTDQTRQSGRAAMQKLLQIGSLHATDRTPLQSDSQSAETGHGSLQTRSSHTLDPAAPSETTALQTAPGVTAVLCANDATAFGALSVPGCDRLSVISIDDIPGAQQTKPALTTVHIPKEEMAHMAVLLLADRLRGGHREHIRMEFPCRIAQRESCRRPEE